MKVFLIDDEQPAIDELQWLLEKYKDIEVADTFARPRKALEAILMKEPEAIFLDIQMPEMDGFELAEALLRLRKPPKIVFVTAYDDYAIQAFEVNAVDYLLKPVESCRLEQALTRLREAVQPKGPVEKVIKDHYLAGRAKRLPLWKDDRIHLISPEDIVYLETHEGETDIYTAKGHFITSESMGHYEEILAGYGFYRCHRSYMIRLEAISEIIPWFNNTYQVKVIGYGDADIPVSRRNVKEFKELLQL